MEEKDIISKIKENDNEALKALYTLRNSVVKDLTLRGATKKDALDIFQDALIMFWRNVQMNKLNI